MPPADGVVLQARLWGAAGPGRPLDQVKQGLSHREHVREVTHDHVVHVTSPLPERVDARLHPFCAAHKPR